MWTMCLMMVVVVGCPGWAGLAVPGDAWQKWVVAR